MQTLNTSYGIHFQTIFDLQEKTLLLTGWGKILEREKTSLEKLWQQNKRLQYQLAVKKLLTTTKTAYYFQFYRNAKLDRIILSHLMNSYSSYAQQNLGANITSHAISLLKKKHDEVSQNLTQLTTNLILPMSLWENFSITCLHALSKNSYYQLSYQYFIACEAASQTTTGQKIPIFNTKLSEGYLTFFSGSLAGIMFSADIYTARWFGLSQTFLNNLSGFALDIDTLLLPSKTLGIPQRILINNLPVLRFFINLSIFVGINLMVHGANWDSTNFLISGYLFASGMQALFNTYIDNWFNNPNKGTNNSTNYLFFKSLLGYAVFMCSTWVWQHLYPLLPRIIQPLPSENELLSDPKKCMENPEICEKAALKVLGLEEGATQQEINEQWRKNIPKYHPDKNREETSREFFYKMNNARKRLKELYITDSSSIQQQNPIAENNVRPILRLSK